MTALGQKRRFGDVRVTSPLPLKADIHRKVRHVSNVPEADIFRFRGHCEGVDHAARTLSRNFSTSSLRWLLTSESSRADFNIKPDVAPVSRAFFATCSILSATLSVPPEAALTPSAILWVAAPCCSTRRKSRR